MTTDEITASDIGRQIVYRSHHGDVEQGVLTSFNATYAFVRFGHDVTSKACLFADLEWTHNDATEI